MNNSNFDIEIINAEFLDTKTGMPILNLSSDEITSVHEPYEREYSTFSFDPTLEIDFKSEISQEFLDYIRTKSVSEECIVELPVEVQRRIHKKKRINKKWRKRYGTVIRYKKYHAKKIDFKTEDFYTVWEMWLNDLRSKNREFV